MTFTQALAMLVPICTASLSCAGLAFAAPDEELLGKSKGYPSGTRANWYSDDSVRVGSYTNLDKLLSLLDELGALWYGLVTTFGRS